MPRIPVDNRRITTAPIQVAPQQQVSPDAFGAGLGEQVQRTAGILHQMAGQEWDRANQAKVDDAAATLAAKRIELGDRLKAARGEQAFGVADAIEKEFDDAITETGGKLVNGAQRDAFRGDAQRLALGLRESVDSHLSVQGEIVAQQKADARATTMFQSGIANRNDEGLAWRDLMDAQATLETYDRSQGVPQEARDARQAALRSKFTADAIEALADDGNHLGAAKWLNGYSTQLKNPADLKRAQDATKAATVKAESQRVAMAITNDPTIDVEHPNLDAAIKRIDEMTTGASQDVRDEARRRTLGMLTQRAGARTETMNGTEYQILSLTNDPQHPLGFDDQQVQALWKQLDPIRQAKTKAALTRIDQPDPIQSRLRRANYELMLGSKDPAVRKQIVDAGPVDASAGMTVEDTKSAIDTWTKTKMAGDGDPTAKKELDGLVSKNEAVMDVLRAGGIDVKKVSDGSYDPIAAAHLDWIDREGKAMQDARPDRKPLTPDDWKVLAGKALTAQTIKGTGFFGGDTSKTTAQMQSALVAQIPAQHRAGIEAAFNATHGRMPTYSELLSSWAVYQKAHPEPPADPNALNKKDIFGLPSKREGVSGFLADLWDLYQ